MSFGPSFRLAGSLSCAAALLVACGGGEQDKSASVAQVAGEQRARALGKTGAPISVPRIAVVGLTKVSETRIGRTEFEYVFRVNIENKGSAAADVAVTLSQVPSGTTVIDDIALFGNVPTTPSLASVDTIKIRQDRSIPFSLSALTWTVKIAPTIDPVGIDSNGNGIRDDIDQAINVIVATRPQIKPAVDSLARGMGSFAVGTGDAPQEQALSMVRSQVQLALCLARVAGPEQALIIIEELSIRTFDTVARKTARHRLLQTAGSFEQESTVSGCAA